MCGFVRPLEDEGRLQAEHGPPRKVLPSNQEIILCSGWDFFNPFFFLLSYTIFISCSLPRFTLFLVLVLVIRFYLHFVIVMVPMASILVSGQRKVGTQGRGVVLIQENNRNVGSEKVASCGFSGPI